MTDLVPWSGVPASRPSALPAVRRPGRAARGGRPIPAPEPAATPRPGGGPIGLLFAIAEMRQQTRRRKAAARAARLEAEYQRRERPAIDRPAPLALPERT